MADVRGGAKTARLNRLRAVPRWRTVAQCAENAGGINDIALTDCTASRVRILCKGRHPIESPEDAIAWDFSIVDVRFFLDDAKQDQFAIPPSARYFASSAQVDTNDGFMSPESAFAPSGRWASNSHYAEPLEQRPEEWIYVEFGVSSPVRHLEIQWQTAFATDYEIQIGADDSPGACELDVADTTGVTCGI